MRRSLGKAVRHWPSVAVLLGLGIVGTVAGTFVRTLYDDAYEFSMPGLLPSIAGWIVGVLVAVAVVRKLTRPSRQTPPGRENGPAGTGSATP